MRQTVELHVSLNSILMDTSQQSKTWCEGNKDRGFHIQKNNRLHGPYGLHDCDDLWILNCIRIYFCFPEYK